MKKSWKTSTLGDTCEMYQPKTISIKEMVADGAYPVYGANGVIGRYDKFNHEEPQLLITCRGATCGSVNISEPMSWITGNAMVVRPKDEFIDLRFLEYLFRGGIDISKAITGAAQPQITRTNLEPLEISYPTAVAEQQRIVAILDEAFAAIATAKENAENNLQNARELFESYLHSIFANPDDEWQEKKLGGVIKLEYGKPLPSSKRKPDGKYPIYGANGEIDRTDEYYHDKQSIIVGRKGSAGEINLAEKKFWPLDVTYFVTFDDKKYSLGFLHNLLLTLNLPKLAKGVKPGINRNEVYEIRVNVPPLPEQQRIVAKLSALSAETKKLETVYENKLAELDELKKSLLQKAFSGEL